MARYNSISQVTTTSTTATITAPTQGLFTEFTGTAPYSVTIPDPTLYPGQTQAFYNSTSGIITMVSPSGVFRGPNGTGTNSFAVSASASLLLASDGTNYIVIAEEGGPLAATSASFLSTVTISPSGANVTISPTSGGTVTVSPAGNLVLSTSGTATISTSTTGTIDNFNIGATTRGSGAFTTLAANSTLSLSMTSGTHTISSTTASSGTGTGALTISGGLGVVGATYIGGKIVTSDGSANTGVGTGALQVTGGAYISGNMYLGGTLTEASTIALKENIRPIGSVIDKLMLLIPVLYDLIDGTAKDEPGLIAEDTYKHIPELVTLDENGKVIGVKYNKISIYLLEALKEIKVDVDSLKGSK